MKTMPAFLNAKVAVSPHLIPNVTSLRMTVKLFALSVDAHRITGGRG